MFNQCAKCFNETTVAYEEDGKLVCGDCYTKVEQFGGEGSGNFGHAGREGEVGGSGEGSGSAKPSRGHLERDGDLGLISTNEYLDRNATHIEKDLKVNRKAAIDMADSIRAFNGNEHIAIRHAQQGRNDEQFLKDKGNAIENYIEKAPSYKGKIYRGQRSKIGNDYKIGQVIDMNGTSSWSSDKIIADEFAQKALLNPGQKRVVFSVNNVIQSASIAHLSFHDEAEVLVSKNQKFKITNMVPNGNVTEITLKEQNA